MTGPRPNTAVTISADRFDAVIFDMDGVITDTARVHTVAWTRLFDEYLATQTGGGVDTRPFTGDDYRRHLDGRARIDGVEAFLASRGIALPRGTSDDPPDAATSWGLANRKNRYFLEALEPEGPRPFASSVALARDLRAAGIRVGVVTASRNRAEVLAAAGVADLFAVHVDGRDAATLGLAGKPAPALFLEAARRLGVEPRRAVVVEDATAGVEAGRRGRFGLVVGVDRTNHADALMAAGADVVVSDLAEVDVAAPGAEGAHQGSEWSFGYTGFVPADEGRREALCALGNGVFATRGAAPESRADGVHYPGTYAAGIYNRLVSPGEGMGLEHESMVNLPNWLPLSFRPAGGDWLDLATMRVERYRQDLDLRRGMLIRCFEVTDAAGRETAVTERRLVHMGRPHLAALEWTLAPRNWSGRLEIRSGLDGTVENRNVAAERDLAGRHLVDVEVGEQGTETLWLTAQTVQSQRHVGQACRTRVEAGGRRDGQARRVLQEPGRIEHRIEFEVTAGEAVRVEKIAALHTSLDPAIADVRTAALTELGDVGTLNQLIEGHELVWGQLWRRARLELLSDDPEVARTLNLHAFHVLQTLSPHIAHRDVGVPARALHGEGYRGHVFWDEVFVAPYLNLRFPELTRGVLLYRYRRLPAARRMAVAMGRRGACYPWQSGSDGREETPTQFFNPRSGRWMPDNSRRQHHVSLAVAYELWQYYQVSGDLDFLVRYGAEMLTEIARFWVDLAELDPTTGRYSIRGVMGPDEFHDGYPDRPGRGIDDNAYTNTMVSWLLRRVLDAYQLLGNQADADAWERLGVTSDELVVWEEVGRRLRVPFHPNRILSQFAGYEDLAEFDWDHYRHRYGNIGRLDLILEAEGDSPNRYKLSKQADVLMLLYLFSAEELTDLLTHLDYSFDPATIPATVDYYTARMSHGSSLCRVAVAWVLARGDRARSWEIFRQTMLSDVADMQSGTTREGIHLGAMAGTIDLVQRCYTGLRVHDDTLWFDPRLPDQLPELRFPVRYRHHWIDVTITHHRIQLCARPGRDRSVRVGICGNLFELTPGQAIEAELTSR